MSEEEHIDLQKEMRDLLKQSIDPLEDTTFEQTKETEINILNKIGILYTAVPWISKVLTDSSLDKEIKNDLKIPLAKLKKSYLKFQDLAYEAYNTRDVESKIKTKAMPIDNIKQIFNEYQEDYYDVLSHLNMIFKILEKDDKKLMNSINVDDYLSYKSLSSGIKGIEIDEEYLLGTLYFMTVKDD